MLVFQSCLSSRPSTSGTSFRGVALAVDRFVGAVDLPSVDTPLSARHEEGFCKDRRVCYEAEMKNNLCYTLKRISSQASIQSGSFADKNDDRQKHSSAIGLASVSWHARCP